MEMHQIRYFIAVCDSGNFTRAAHAAGVSQPSLTQAIGKLEEELGGTLFIRDRGGCRLTDLGRMVEPNLRQIQDNSQSIKADAVRFVRQKKVPLRLGVMPSTGSRRLGPLLARFQQRFPAIELEVIVEPDAQALKRLQAGTIDLAIGAPAAPLGNAYACQGLYTERYVVVFPRRHRFAAAERIALRDLVDEPYLDRLNCELRESLKAVCREREVALYAAYRSNDEEWILQMVRGGIGVAIMPEYSLPAADDALESRLLDDPALSREVMAIRRRAEAGKPELVELIRFLGR